MMSDKNVFNVKILIVSDVITMPKYVKYVQLDTKLSKLINNQLLIREPIVKNVKKDA